MNKRMTLQTSVPSSLEAPVSFPSDDDPCAANNINKCGRVPPKRGLRVSTAGYAACFSDRRLLRQPHDARAAMAVAARAAEVPQCDAHRGFRIARLHAQVEINHRAAAVAADDQPRMPRGDRGGDLGPEPHRFSLASRHVRLPITAVLFFEIYIVRRWKCAGSERIADPARTAVGAIFRSLKISGV